MIKVTRINKKDRFWVNEYLIEVMEETPDTILTMLSGRKVSVAESADEIVKLIAEVRRPVIVPRSEYELSLEQGDGVWK